MAVLALDEEGHVLILLLRRALGAVEIGQIQEDRVPIFHGDVGVLLERHRPNHALPLEQRLLRVVDALGVMAGGTPLDELAVTVPDLERELGDFRWKVASFSAPPERQWQPSRELRRR
jgi:hypothetical protein